ncbi:hypothetical protein ACFU99_08880 [Streptomyces sp. NPDC057654]|uniref:hypothetical protein n=1 Tax=Streptomyces sp. NPDC057654 TaxID=3346196 RepID=UPI0036976680
MENRHADARDGSAPLDLTIHLDGKTAATVRRIAAIKKLPPEEIAAECVRDELRRETYDALYMNATHYAVGLNEAARKLAEMVCELGALPARDAAKAVALAETAKLGPLPYEWRQRILQQLTSLWEGRTTEFGRRADGTTGPLEDADLGVRVTPEQWDACARIGAPDSLAAGARKALAAGIEALDQR